MMGADHEKEFDLGVPGPVELRSTWKVNLLILLIVLLIALAVLI
jgi:hypothetical protein